VAVSITLEQLSTGQNNPGKARKSTRCKPERLARPRTPSDKETALPAREQRAGSSARERCALQPRRKQGNPLPKWKRCVRSDRKPPSAAFPPTRRALPSPGTQLRVDLCQGQSLETPGRWGGRNQHGPPSPSHSRDPDRAGVMVTPPRHPPSCRGERPQLPHGRAAGAAGRARGEAREPGATGMAGRAAGGIPGTQRPIHPTPPPLPRQRNSDAGLCAASWREQPWVLCRHGWPPGKSSGPREREERSPGVGWRRSRAPSRMSTGPCLPQPGLGSPGAGPALRGIP